MRSKIDSSPARVSVQEGRGLDHLLAISASFALECIVSIADGLFVELKELSKGVDREMPFGRICLAVDDARRQGHLVGPVGEQGYD